MTIIKKTEALNLKTNTTIEHPTENVISFLDMTFSKAMPTSPQFINADLMTEDEIHAKLQEGYDDLNFGRVLDADTAFARFIEKHKSDVNI